jgi:hypothetical protein
MTVAAGLTSEVGVTIGVAVFAAVAVGDAEGVAVDASSSPHATTTKSVKKCQHQHNLHRKKRITARVIELKSAALT